MPQRPTLHPPSPRNPYLSSPLVLEASYPEEPPLVPEDPPLNLAPVLEALYPEDPLSLRCRAPRTPYPTPRPREPSYPTLPSIPKAPCSEDLPTLPPLPVSPHPRGVVPQVPPYCIPLSLRTSPTLPPIPEASCPDDPPTLLYPLSPKHRAPRTPYPTPLSSRRRAPRTLTLPPVPRCHASRTRPTLLPVPEVKCPEDAPLPYPFIPEDPSTLTLLPEALSSDDCPTLPYPLYLRRLAPRTPFPTPLRPQGTVPRGLPCPALPSRP
uniref:Uncharacterized protein n=1 Tax=Solanum lycopersicum TaxID=4081 RepID=K4AXT8_SOLLC